MSAIEPAGEKIVRNLQQAIERLQDDIKRVELWAGALGCFTKPIPDYGHGRTHFDLPAAHPNTKSKSAKSAGVETSRHRTTASPIGSPRATSSDPTGKS